MKPLRKCILLFGIPRHLSKLLLESGALGREEKKKKIIKRSGDNTLVSKQDHLCEVTYKLSSRVISRGHHRFPGVSLPACINHQSCSNACGCLPAQSPMPGAMQTRGREEMAFQRNAS